MRAKLRKKIINKEKRNIIKKLEELTNSKIVREKSARWSNSMYFSSSALPNYLLATDGARFWGKHIDDVKKFSLEGAKLQAYSVEEFAEAILSTAPKQASLHENILKLERLKKQKDWLRSGQVFEDIEGIYAIAMIQSNSHACKYELTVVANNEDWEEQLVEHLSLIDFKIVDFQNSFADSMSQYCLIDDNPSYEVIVPDAVLWGTSDENMKPKLTFTN